jgi:hypothetical protein
MWIWYPGDFEIFHSLRLHCRRQERDCMYPAFWRLDDCWHNVKFKKDIILDKSETVITKCCGFGYVLINGRKYPLGKDFFLDKGECNIVVNVARQDGLPAIFIKGRTFSSGPDWESDNCTGHWFPSGCSGMYTDIDDDPEKFKFAYTQIKPQSIQKKDGGILFDFGKELFAKLCFTHAASPEPVSVYYGESETEALDKDAYLYDEIPANKDIWEMENRAFRYIFIKKDLQGIDLSADFEYLPLERRGSFASSDKKLNSIWETAAYTFHLNCREFFLDGIKRDRWVWSLDAYQSILINNYLYFDADITKRTLIALRGKDPPEQHLNTILEYSFYWIISIGEYYFNTGDIDFLRFIWPKMVSLLEFCLSRLDGMGFASGLPGDWVFIDWAEIDKTGAVAAEQIIFCNALSSMALCAEVLGYDSAQYMEAEKALHNKTNEYFWNSELHAYIDSFSSGKNNITRHANIFALLFNFADEAKKQEIIKYVLQNDKVAQITTPAWKFWELEALCVTGNHERAKNVMLSYWGDMLDLGVTTFWEEYKPDMEFPEHYAMYGDKYGKSLCHAWGASPIYLLGRYFLGIRPETSGYSRFVCTPNLGGLDWMEGTVPAPGGGIRLYMDKNSVRIQSEKNPGSVILNGIKTEILPGEEMYIKI